MSDQFKLSPADRDSPVWRALSDHLTEELATMRSQNDAQKDAIDTAFLRGKIAQLKALLALAEDRRPIRN